MFVFVIRNAITVSIFSNTVRINWCAGWSVRFAIELISYAITVCIRQNRSRQFHVTWVGQLAVSVFQRVDPP